jgi:hypothetical protein
VNVSGVKVGGLLDDRFNGRFPIKSVTSPTEADPRYKLEFEINVDVTVAPNFTAFGLVGSALQVLSGEGGTEAVLESNRVFHCLTGGPYHDTWASRDVMVRNNYYHDVITGPYQNIGPGVSTTDAGIGLASLTVTGGVATAVTNEPHGLIAGSDEIVISGSIKAECNGTFVVSSVGPNDAKIFKYVPKAGVSDGAGGNAVYLFKHPSFGQLKLVESLIKLPSGTGFVVTAKTTYNNHGLLKGDAIEIARAGHFDRDHYPKSILYNGSFTIIDVPDNKTFKYFIDADPVVDSNDPDFAAGYFGRIWQSRISDYEDNVVELSSLGDEGRPFSFGLGQYDPQTGITRINPYTYLQLLARGNIVRPVDTRYGLVNSSLSSAVIFNSCEKALVDGNIIDLDYATPISFFKSGVVVASHNQTSAGVPLSGLDQDAGRPVDDMARKIEDALGLSLL